ncbi:hypothetical protein BKA56DRAFT_664723 [Ilyonectria sp. MPI-CAGE-AT-0026]|nr:hypothetical protein BKA56DRAFT_664723 [Ilyonectria sp. MPI-CAGE-AT-0026]
MGKQTAVPDAWEDDWESQADKVANEDQQQPQQPEPQAPLSKAERLAQHAEANRRIWESADSPQTFHYVEANASVPLANAFKPQVKVLSRKPMIAKRDPVTGKLIDDEEEAKKEVQLSPEEIRAKQKRDREEKQRRYEEARAKIFGESNPSSGASSPGAVTPPRSDGHFAPRGRGRGRGGYRNNNENRQFDNRQFDNRQFDNRQFDAPRRPLNPSGSGRELYDPNFTPKPESSTAPRRANDNPNPSKADQNPIRAPKGPDGSGRGGFGFAQRGAKES